MVVVEGAIVDHVTRAIPQEGQVVGRRKAPLLKIIHAAIFLNGREREGRMGIRQNIIMSEASYGQVGTRPYWHD